jgi:hypothetical protein
MSDGLSEFDQETGKYKGYEPMNDHGKAQLYFWSALSLFITLCIVLGTLTSYREENQNLKKELYREHWKLHNQGLGKWVEDHPGHYDFILKNNDLPNFPVYEPTNK